MVERLCFTERSSAVEVFHSFFVQRFALQSGASGAMPLDVDSVDHERLEQAWCWSCHAARKRGCPPKIIIWELLLGSRGCFLEWRISVRHWRNKSLRGGLLGLAVSLLQPLLHLAIAVLLKSLSSSGSCILILLLEQGLAVVSSPRRRLVVLAKGIKRPRHCVQAVKVLPRGYQRFFIDNCCCSAVLSSSAENRLHTPYIAAATHPRATCGCG
nr:uncharacterized protein LOC112273086 [Physcomitrium patens]|eukprot:XP_024357233.1 uncharacterized protein LOC112273086 [Physcomitrella patens]